MTLDVNHPNKWDADYRRGTDGWDLDGPTPALRRLAESGQFAPGRMLVPCAGRGHDAREFARHGFDVTAVDFSEYAVGEMKRLVDAQAPIQILQQDLFGLPPAWDASFDYVLQYTCFCAIDPNRRADYADIIRRVLKPAGTYIDLAFPLDGRAGGPPYAVTETEIVSLFESRGFQLISATKPEDSVAARRQVEKLLIFRRQTESSEKQT